MLTLYGIPNCDKVRLARSWLSERQLDYRFHDLRKDGLSQQLLDTWLSELGADALINRRSSTWRKLSEDERAALDSGTGHQILMQQVSLLKRPLLDTGKRKILGFIQAEYESLL